MRFEWTISNKQYVHILSIDIEFAASLLHRFYILIQLIPHYLTETEAKWPPIFRRYLQTYFLDWKLTNWMRSLMSNWEYVIIGIDNGLSRSRRQAIIWTNDGLVYWGIYASLGLNELIVSTAYSIHTHIQYHDLDMSPMLAPHHYDAVIR